MISSYNIESAIAFHHVISFLQKQGTKFDFGKTNLSEELVYLTNDMNLTKQGKGNLKRLYNKVKSEFSSVRSTNRAMHFGNTIFMRPTGNYVNTFHQELENVPTDSDDIMLNIQDRKPKAISAGYRYTGYAIQLIMTLATIMYFYNRFSSHVVENEQEDNSLQNSI
jgi:hypothetical protein